MSEFQRYDYDVVEPDRVLDEVTQISCNAIQDTIVAYSEYSSSYGRFLNLTEEAQTVIVLEDVPENCPLRYMHKRDVEQFAEACGSCTLANFIF